jgi:hypothetical protein
MKKYYKCKNNKKLSPFLDRNKKTKNRKNKYRGKNKNTLTRRKPDSNKTLWKRGHPVGSDLAAVSLVGDIYVVL